MVPSFALCTLVNLDANVHLTKGDDERVHICMGLYSLLLNALHATMNKVPAPQRSRGPQSTIRAPTFTLPVLSAGLVFGETPIRPCEPRCDKRQAVQCQRVASTAIPRPHPPAPGVVSNVPAARLDSDEQAIVVINTAMLRSHMRCATGRYRRNWDRSVASGSTSHRRMRV